MLDRATLLLTHLRPKLALQFLQFVVNATAGNSQLNLS